MNAVETAAAVALDCPMPAEPPPRANEAEGKAKTAKTKAIFTALFDIGNLHEIRTP
jgi:hypothetical protein